MFTDDEEQKKWVGKYFFKALYNILYVSEFHFTRHKKTYSLFWDVVPEYPVRVIVQFCSDMW